MKYMQDFGYKVIPVNPFAEGEIINGEKVVKDKYQLCRVLSSDISCLK